MKPGNPKFLKILDSNVTSATLYGDQHLNCLSRGVYWLRMNDPCSCGADVFQNGLSSGIYWIRTGDLCPVKAAL